MSEVQVFWRPPLTSSSHFSLKDLQAPCGILSDSCDAPAVIKVAGWIPGRLLEAASHSPVGRVARCAQEVEHQDLPEGHVVFHGGPGEIRWSGLLELDPGSRLRLVGPSHFRLNYARARHSLPHAVLAEVDAHTGTDPVRQWFEVSFNPRGGKAGAAKASAECQPSATIEVCGPKVNGINSTWQPVAREQLCSPETWPLLGADSGAWVTSHGAPSSPPKPWRNSPQRLREGGMAPAAPAVALLVVMAAVAPETGVGCMTPNWTLLAALDEALHRALGANYELHVMPISSEEQLRQLDPSRVTSLLQGAQAPGAVYFLSPQRVAGDFRTKHDLVHDLPLFGLMEALEEAGIPTVWPHPSYLYRVLAGKEWPSQLCLSPQYHVPLTTRVSRQAVLTKGLQAAEEAWQSLCWLMESVGRPLPSSSTTAVRAAVKVGFSWRSSGVQLCRGDLLDLSKALSKAAAAGQHASFMVQELIQGVLCEAMIYVINGEMVAHPQYYRFPEHQAPPQYIPRKSAAQILGGESAQQRCEEKMRGIVKHWMLWARSMSSSPIPFLRIDFLLAAPCEADSAGDVEVWTGEVSELGVAVELQGMNSHESRDLVVDAVVASLLKGAG